MLLPAAQAVKAKLHWLDSALVAVRAGAETFRKPVKGRVVGLLTRALFARAILGVALFCGFAGGCKGPTTELRAKLVFDHHQPGVIAVNISLVHLKPGENLRLEFYLPDEGMNRSEWHVRSPKIHDEITTESHSGGILFRRSLYNITADQKGTIDVSFRSVIGRRVEIHHFDFFGPRYSFADESTIITDLDYILPRIHLYKQRRVAYHVDLDPGGYSFQSPLKITGDIGNDMRFHNLLVAGSFISTSISVGERQIEFRTFHALDDGLLRLTKLFLSSVAPLFSRTNRLPTVFAVPTSETDAVEPMHSPSIVALDLQPFTPERGLRFIQTLVGSLLLDDTHTRHFTASDEYWLLYSLPKYYAIQVLARTNFLQKDQTLYDIALTYKNIQRYHVPLETVFLEKPVLRGYITETQGVLVLEALAVLLDHGRYSLDTVIFNFFHSAVGLHFFHYVALSLGLSFSRTFWRQNVERPFADQPKQELTLKPEPDRCNQQTESFHVLVTGNIEGYLELCGCKSLQAGGAARRFQYISTARSDTTFLFDLGNFLSLFDQKSTNRINEMESRKQLKIMEQTSYSAVALGHNEVAWLSYLPEILHLRSITSANIPGISVIRELSLHQRHFSIIAWIDPPAIETYKNSVWVMGSRSHITYDPEVLERTVSMVRRDSSIVLIGYIHPLTIEHIVSHFRNVIAVFSSYKYRLRFGYYKNAFIAFFSDGDSHILDISARYGQSSILASAVNYRILDGSIPQSTSVQLDLDRMYNSTEFMTAAVDSEKRPPWNTTGKLAHPQSQEYVGSTACRECHVPQYIQWRGTPHAAALSTLSRVHRDHHPACVRCHVTGYGIAGGYTIPTRPLAMANVGCEECHGAGAQHILSPATAGLVRKPGDQACQSCHDEDHSLFGTNPQKYREQIIH